MLADSSLYAFTLTAVTLPPFNRGTNSSNDCIDLIPFVVHTCPTENECPYVSCFSISFPNALKFINGRILLCEENEITTPLKFSLTSLILFLNSVAFIIKHYITLLVQS